MSLIEHGIYIEGMGGDIAYALVSSKTGEGISELLDLVFLTADISEFTADATAPATGFVL
jgi:translation initiation factor IF-2